MAPYLMSSCDQQNNIELIVMYVSDILLNPPAYAIATTIQEICKLMSNVSCTIPEFTCISPSKLVREANHVEFCKIKSVLDEILQLYRNSELNRILRLLMDPSYLGGNRVEKC
ncbi:hypothetical protein L6452_09134 [Arctium lappa]|uniref:Uncharacterized protein n=1 Tax=Arctium lappa TaxID=4217 RepID=A0ACB9DJT6_ARCLA|nr:hypothetical protein L6452_09134 [Arctium lappa]